MSRYPFSCECGSVFMTSTLLAAHKQANVCKPNKQYTLGITVRESRRTSKEKPCAACGGKGFREFGRPKDGSRSIITAPCGCSTNDGLVGRAWSAVTRSA